MSSVTMTLANALNVDNVKNVEYVDLYIEY